MLSTRPLELMASLLSVNLEQLQTITCLRENVQQVVQSVLLELAYACLAIDAKAGSANILMLKVQVEILEERDMVLEHSVEAVLTLEFKT